MSKIRLVVVCQIAAAWLVCGPLRPIAAQPPDAATWTGISPLNPTAYDVPGNWVDLATGGIPPVPPDATSDVFFDAQAGQADRDPFGNVVVSLRQTDSGAQSMSVQVLPFRFVGGGTLTIGELAQPGQGTLNVQEAGMLTLDAATLDVRDSVLIGGGPPGPTGLTTGITVLPDGALIANDSIQLSGTPGSRLQLLGGSVRAATIDTGFDSSQFQWEGGQLSFDQFFGDLSNPAGTLVPGIGPAIATIEGNYSQDTFGRLNVQIGGTTPGQEFDRLIVGGTLNAGGTFAVALTGGFTPSAGNEFDILDFGALSGVFDNVILPGLPDELEWDVANLHDQGILRVIRPGTPLRPAVWAPGAVNNDYFNPANWANGIVPINTENASFGVAIPTGAMVSVAGDAAVLVTGFDLATGGTFNVSGGANFEVGENGTISGILSVSGPDSSFVTGNAPVALEGAPRLMVSGGGLLQVAAERFAISVDPGTRVLLSATDPGSLLDLSAMQELSVEIPTNSAFFVTATNGADADLTGLTEISGVLGGLGRLVVSAGPGSRVHLGSVEVSNRANLEATGPGAEFEVGGNLQLRAASRLSLTGGAAMNVGGDLNYDIVNPADFNADGGTIQFTGNGMQMFEVGGQDLGDIGQGGPSNGNFGVGRLVVGQAGAPTSVMLMDAADNGGNNAAEALYVFGGSTASGVEIMEGSTLHTNGLNVYTNGVASAGEIRLDGVLSATNTVVSDGTLSGNGLVRSGMVLHNGILSPGFSAGEIEIDSDVEAGEDSVMQIEIGGPMPVMQYDRVRISKTMLLDGGLEVTLIDGGMGVFVPNKGDEFDILSANAGIQGTFTSVSLPPLPSALGWQLQYEPTVVSLSVLERLGGDFDADGDVDRNDFMVWQDGAGITSGASQTDGDSDGDGDVDGDDLLGLVLNFGASPMAALASTPAAIPEPSTLVLAGVAMLLVLSRIGFQPVQKN